MKYIKTLFITLSILLIATSAFAYYPQGNSIVSKNGKNRFTRAIYGTNTPFRFETSDFPEIGMYMPNLGGSLYFALKKGEAYVWLKDLASIEAAYEAGKRYYTLKDEKWLGTAELTVSFLALGDADGVIAKMECSQNIAGLEVVAIYGGANDEHFRREGDMGADRIDCFYITAEKCKGNQFSWKENRFELAYGKKNEKTIQGYFSENPTFKVVNPANIEDINKLMTGEADSQTPLLAAAFPLATVSYISLLNPITTSTDLMTNLRAIYNRAETFRLSVANKVSIKTPDIFLNPVGNNLAMAADAVWQSPVYNHGSIGWRIPLLGWRHCYIGDFLGWKDRGRSHFDYYAEFQLENMPDKPVTMDPLQEYARSAYVLGTPMYSSGYIANCQENGLYFYDMNLVYIDALLWHLEWTADWEYAQKMWPVIERHLAWEKRTFDPDGNGLYDAVCCIWASDALQYNGGEVTHSTAYNYRANKKAAQIAEKLGVDGSTYKAEADKIMAALKAHLWIDEKGWWGEYRGTIKNRELHESAAAWTFYHAIDSELSDDNLDGYQAARYAMTGLPHIPVVNKETGPTGYHVVSTTNWMPYDWSVNNVAFAETIHTALALYQTGMNDEAYNLMMGGIVDVMYQGKSPGNFGMTTSYDVIGEVYRDFSDGVGIFARLLVQGLFGITPNGMNNSMQITPGFPADWNDAEIETSDLRFSFQKEQKRETYSFTQKTDTPFTLLFKVPARYDGVKSVTLNGKKIKGAYVDYVGKPMYEIACEATRTCELEIVWEGEPINQTKLVVEQAQGDLVNLAVAKNVKLIEIIDPQQVLADAKIQGNQIGGKVVGSLGARTLFAKVKQGGATWTLPIEMELSKPIEIIPAESESTQLSFQLKNNSNQPITLLYSVNGNAQGELTLAAKGMSETIYPPTESVVKGTNQLELKLSNGLVLTERVVNWEVANKATARFTPLAMETHFNDTVGAIFRNEYLTPRTQNTTLRIPIDGYGDWCVPLRKAEISDRGFRSKVENGIFQSSIGIPFLSPSAANEKNILYTSLWDNYPDSVSIPLKGKGNHLYLLMAGSTNHMQSRFVNARVKVYYADGSVEEVNLVNPDNWAPIDQDYYVDNYAYKINQPRPYRVLFKDGTVSRNLTKDLHLTAKSKRMIDQGAGLILDVPLHPEKELKRLVLSTEAYEIIVGLMGITLME